MRSVERIKKVMEECDVQVALQAIQAVYSPNTHTQLMHQANQYLVNLREHTTAFSILTTILQAQDTSDEAKWYAVTALRYKAYGHVYQLNEQQRSQLFNALAEIAVKMKPSQTRRMLSRVLGILALHRDTKDVVKQMIETIPSCERPNLLALLETLEAIPEEIGASDLSIDVGNRYAISKNLEQFTMPIFVICCRILEGSPGDKELIVTTFRVLSSWTRFGADCVKPNELYETVRALTPLCIAALDIQEVFEDAIDCICQFIRATSEWERHYQVVFQLVTTVLNLQPAYQNAVQNSNEIVQHGLCRLFLELGETYSIFITKFIGYCGDECAMSHQIIECILHCSANKNYEIAFLTFNFWFLLSDALLNPRNDGKVNHSSVKAVEPYILKFMQIMEATVRYPNDFESLDEDDLGTYRYLRYETCSILQDVAGLLPESTCLNSLLSSLQYHVQHDKWQDTEATLHILRSVARSIDFKNSRVFPDILGLFPQLQHHFQVRYTALLIVGRYSEWFNYHPEYLPMALDLVTTSLDDENLQVRSAAALSFQFLCSSCCLLLIQESTLTQLLMAYERSLKLLLTDRLELIEGICNVLSNCPMDMKEELVTRLVNPLIRDVYNEFNSGVVNDTTIRNLDFNLKLLVQIFRYYRSSHSVNIIPLFNILWDISQKLFERFRSERTIMKKVCKLWSYIFRNMNECPEAIFFPLLEHVVKCYSLNPLRYYLSLLKSLISIFGRFPKYQCSLSQVLHSLCDPTLILLSSTQQFDEIPRFAEEFFVLSTEYMKVMPRQFFTSAFLTVAFRCGIVGFHASHQETHREIMYFFKKLFDMGRTEKNENEIVALSVAGLVQNYGKGLSDAIIEGIISLFPRSKTNSLAEAVDAMIKFDPSFFGNLFVQSTKTFPPHFEDAKVKFLNSIFSAKTVKDKRKAILDLREAFRYS